MPLNPVNGSDILAAAFQKLNANDSYLESRLTSLETDPAIRRFDYNPDLSGTLAFAVYGGQYEDTAGESLFAPDQVVTATQGLVADAENFIQLDYATGQMYATQLDFDDDVMRLYRVTLDAAGNIVGQPVDARAPDRAQISVGFNHYTQAGDALNDYRFRGGQVRYDNKITTILAGVLTGLADGVHYVQIRRIRPGEVTIGGVKWLVAANANNFTQGAVPLAVVTVAAGKISQVRDVRGAMVAGAGGGSSFYNAVTWMML